MIGRWPTVVLIELPTDPVAVGFCIGRPLASAGWRLRPCVMGRVDRRDDGFCASVALVPTRVSATAIASGRHTWPMSLTSLAPKSSPQKPRLWINAPLSRSSQCGATTSDKLPSCQPRHPRCPAPWRRDRSREHFSGRWNSTSVVAALVRRKLRTHGCFLLPDADSKRDEIER